MKSELLNDLLPPLTIERPRDILGSGDLDPGELRDGTRRITEALKNKDGKGFNRELDEALRSLSKRLFHVEERDKILTSMMIMEMLAGRFETARFCVEMGAEVNGGDRGSPPGLFVACLFGKWEMVKELVDLDAWVNKKAEMYGKTEFTALHFAVGRKANRCADELLKGGANPNERSTTHKITPLMVAAARGNEHGVIGLLENGAHLYDMDLKMRQAKDWAEAFGHEKVIEILTCWGEGMMFEESVGEKKRKTRAKI